jgi:hypothetical protein
MRIYDKVKVDQIFAEVRAKHGDPVSTTCEDYSRMNNPLVRLWFTVNGKTAYFSLIAGDSLLISNHWSQRGYMPRMAKYDPMDAAMKEFNDRCDAEAVLAEQDMLENWEPSEAEKAQKAAERAARPAGQPSRFMAAAEARHRN